MTTWQSYLIFAYTILAAIFLAAALPRCRKGQAYKKSLPLNLIGAFVWGDAVVFGLFWTIAGLVILYWGNWLIFLTTLLVFWLIRSVGEMIYWFNQQFSTINRNPPRKLWFYQYFKNDSVWFVYQIFWQCIATISLVLLIILWHN